MLLHTMRRWLAANSAPQIVTVAAAPGLPTGKGMFISGLPACGKPADVARRIRQAGITWVAILGPFTRRGRTIEYWNTKGAEPYLRAIRETGARIWVWGWPAPATQVAVMRELARLADAWQVDGIILDVEHDYYGQPAAARRLMDAALATGHIIMVTSYGAPWHHSILPWAELARAAAGIPQAYGNDHRLGLDYPAKSVAAWRDLGFQVVIPAFPGYGKKAQGRLAEWLGVFPAAQAFIGWQWRHVDPREWEIIAAWSPPSSEASA